MAEHYSLLDEPWIDVVDHQGIESRISIRSLLEEASSYRALAAPLGTANFAILRLLLAILYRAWDNREWRDIDNAIDHWQRKWEQDVLLDGEVASYLDTWSERFDLRSADHPFFQVAGLHTSKNEWKSLDILFPDVGDVGDLYTMRTDLHSVSAAEAAQMVVHCMAYDFSGIKSGAVGDDRVKGGKGYPIGIGWCGWLGGTMLEGENLRETLLLNYVPHRPEAGTEDRPLWEFDDIGPGIRDNPRYRIEPPSENGTTGQVELLTWPQRRILLRWDGDLVTGVLVTNGDPVGYTTKNDVETMSPWRFSDPQTKKAKSLRFMPQTLDAGRAMWRSVGGILPNDSPPTTEVKVAGVKVPVEKLKPAKSIQWLGELVGDDILSQDREFRIHMVSMEYGAQSSSFAGIIEDAITVRSPLLAVGNNQLRATARQAVEMADGAARALWMFAKNIAVAVSGNQDDADTDKIQAQLYTRIDRDFRVWIRGLGAERSGEGALVSWAELVRASAMELAAELLSAQGPEVWAGRWDGNRRVTGAVAEIWLRKNLNECLGKAPLWRDNSTKNGDNS